jgi:hypothetical protein
MSAESRRSEEKGNRAWYFEIAETSGVRNKALGNRRRLLDRE